jgi:signal transduction histidine kinase
MAVLKREGLVKALNHHLLRLPEHLNFNFEATAYIPQPEIEEAMLRIAQEAIGNVVKHAQASVVKIQLSTTGQACYLSVADNGQGFGEVKDGTHMGLRTMLERAQAVGGNVRVDSTPGQGTRVEVTIPLKKES